MGKFLEREREREREKLSVIIPVYNVQQYLKECLDSIINQTLKNIEIIIVNDCSPDNSEAIILEYLQKDPRIKYIKHQQNLGLGGARNTGIQQATGEWISFVDSDDYLELDCYQNMMALLSKNHADCAIFGVINFDNITKLESYEPYFNIPENLTNDKHTLFYLATTAWNKIYKTADIKNIKFPEHLKHEDEEFWHKYSALIKPLIIGDPKKYYHYRQRKNSIISNNQSKKDLSQIAINIYSFYKKHHLESEYEVLFLDLCFSYIEASLVLSSENKQIFDDEINSLICSIYNNIGMEFIKIYKLLTQTKKQNYHLYNDRWYKFGQLSRINKIKKIFSFFFKKLFNLVRK